MQRFNSGETVATPGALDALREAGVAGAALIARHLSGDWGDLSKDDREANEEALKYGLRILSAYGLPTGVRIWVITEADRSSTCILLPEEY